MPEHVEGVASATASVNRAVGPARGVVADPAEPVVGHPRRAAAAVGDLVGRSRRRSARGACRRCGGRSRVSSSIGVEIEVLADLEPIAERGREQAAAGRRPDQRERPQLSC